MATSTKWYDDHTTVAAFSQVLEDAGVLDPENPESYSTFIKSPFKYDEIFDSWKDLNYPSQGEDGWDEFTSLLEEDDDEEDET